MIIGGFSNGQPTNAVHTFDLTTWSIEKFVPLNKNRYSHSCIAAVMEGKEYVFAAGAPFFIIHCRFKFESYNKIIIYPTHIIKCVLTVHNEHIKHHKKSITIGANTLIPSKSTFMSQLYNLRYTLFQCYQSFTLINILLPYYF